MSDKVRPIACDFHTIHDLWAVTLGMAQRPVDQNEQQRSFRSMRISYEGVPADMNGSRHNQGRCIGLGTMPI